jgi:mono/diheme cytochrome c family protein
MSSKYRRLAIASLACAAMFWQVANVFAADSVPNATSDDALGRQLIERGRYLVKVGGCNDCHTPGYGASGGRVPEKQWLTGDKLGWQGPWGTTYPANLRLVMNRLSEKEWLHVAHTAQYRPPMPWFTLHAMTTEDLRAMYRFVRSLGPAGEPAPAYLPPNQEVQGPVVKFPMPVAN